MRKMYGPQGVRVLQRISQTHRAPEQSPAPVFHLAAHEQALEEGSARCQHYWEEASQTYDLFDERCPVHVNLNATAVFLANKKAARRASK